MRPSPRPSIPISSTPRLTRSRLHGWASGPDQFIANLENAGLDGDRFNRPIFISKDAYVPYTGAVMTIDPSAGGKDETAFCVTKFLNGIVYVRRWGGFPNGHSVEVLEALARIAKEEEVNEIEVESNFGGTMFAQLLQPVVNRLRPCRVTNKRVSVRKEKRILDTLEPTLKQHRLVIDTKVVEEDRKADSFRRGFFQMTRITTATGALDHDDRIDCLAAAVAYWTDYMNADTQKALAKHERKVAMDEDRKRWAGTPLASVYAKKNPLARGHGRPLRR